MTVRLSKATLDWWRKKHAENKRKGRPSDETLLRLLTEAETLAAHVDNSQFFNPDGLVAFRVRAFAEELGKVISQLEASIR